MGLKQNNSPAGFEDKMAEFDLLMATKHDLAQAVDVLKNRIKVNDLPEGWTMEDAKAVLAEAEKLKSAQETLGKGMEPLNFNKEVNSLIASTRRWFKKWLLPILAAGGLAGYSGDRVQDGYRDITGYNRTPIEDIQSSGEDRPASEEPTPAQENRGEKGALEEVTDFAKEKLSKAGKWAGKKAVEIVNSSDMLKEFIQDIRGTMDEFVRLKNAALEFGDKAFFWGPFLLVFLATLKLTKVAISIKRNIDGKIDDPQVEEGFEVMESQINDLIRRHNAGLVITDMHMRMAMRLANQLQRQSFAAANALHWAPDEPLVSNTTQPQGGNGNGEQILDENDIEIVN